MSGHPCLGPRTGSLREKGTDESFELAEGQEIGLITCVRDEGVQGVLTLFCSGAAQVCHDDRVVELKEQLEVEEEDGDRQEEEVEVEREKRVKEGTPC